MNTKPHQRRFGRPTAPRNKAWPELAFRARKLGREIFQLGDDLSRAGVLPRLAASAWRMSERLELLAETLEQDHHRRPRA